MPHKTFNILTDTPAITYPNGGENITSNSIEVTWTEPSSISDNTNVAWYEIFIVDNYESRDNRNLVQIASIPIGNTSFEYNVNNNLKGKKCRISMRVANSLGERGPLVFSANDFVISNRKLPIPAIFKPTPDTTYFSYIPIVFDNKGVVGRCSQRSFYQMYYKSDEQEIDWTLGISNIMMGSGQINWDVSSLPTASDYSLKFEIVDEDKVSEPVFINDITINNINYFLVDTLPPYGQIKVRDNEEYTNKSNLVLEVKASDGTTGVKDYKIEQINVSGAGTISSGGQGQYQKMSEVSTWTIPNGDDGLPIDGVKIIQARFRDYGNNVVISDISSKYFRTYKSLSNIEISAFVQDGSDIWYAFGSDSNPSDIPQLYKNTVLVSSLSGVATALHPYDSAMYIAIKDSDNKGILQRYTNVLESVASNTAQYLDVDEMVVNSLYETDSVINAMEVFDDSLFLGLQNGKLLYFSGSTVREVNSDYQYLRNITGLKKNGNLLYVYFENSLELGVLRVNQDSTYSLIIVDIEE